MSVLFLTKDLVFSSRLSGLTQASGIELCVVSQADQLVANASTDQVQLVLLDLSMPGLDPKQLVPQLRRLTRPPKAIIAFGPHVHAARLAAAREAGCDEVLALGVFNSRMAGVLAEYVDGGDQTGDEAEASDSAEQV
jgi:CheY-like chemotaxis protein